MGRRLPGSRSPTRVRAAPMLAEPPGRPFPRFTLLRPRQALEQLLEGVPGRPLEKWADLAAEGPEERALPLLVRGERGVLRHLRVMESLGRPLAWSGAAALLLFASILGVRLWVWLRPEPKPSSQP